MGHLQQMLFNEYTNENSELKCAICRKCLSVQPILHNSVYGNICGRWKCNSLGNSKGQNHEQQAYENVARYLIFPCMYRDNGCNAELKWSDVQLHEEACQFKKFFCPLSNNAFLKQGEKVCIWTGEISEFPNHVVESHSNRFFCESLVIDFQRNYTHEREIFFSKVLEDIILVIFHVNDSKSALFCKVWAGISIFKNLQYQISIKDLENNSVALRKQSVDLVNLTSVGKTIDKDWLKIDFDNMQNFVENPNSIVIEFEYDSIKLGSSINSLTVPKILYDGVVSDDLRNAKCDNCKKELVPPVFMCLRAHNICGSCKISEACPKCTVFLTKSTNTAFEKLKFLVNQPCSNYSKGCNYSGPYPNILDHEDICIFKLRKCILGCPQEVNNILQHLKLEHSHSISELNISYNLNLLKSHVFLFDDQIFLFSKQLEIDRSFSFNINCLGMKEVRYKFELFLTNKKFVGSEMMLSNICYPDMVDLKKHGLTNVIYIPYVVFGTNVSRHEKLEIQTYYYENHNTTYRGIQIVTQKTETAHYIFYSNKGLGVIRDTKKMTIFNDLFFQ